MPPIYAIDANLLVLLIVGSTDLRFIEIHKRCSQFTKKEFSLLVDVLGGKEVIVTPNVLSEASNLIRQVKDPVRTEIMVVFQSLIRKAREIAVASGTACERQEFVRLGLTDAVLLEILDEQTVLLTTDLDLYLAAVNTGKNAINFNHVIEMNLPVQL